jgi:hypothetical protein
VTPIASSYARCFDWKIISRAMNISLLIWLLLFAFINSFSLGDTESESYIDSDKSFTLEQCEEFVFKDHLPLAFENRMEILFCGEDAFVFKNVLLECLILRAKSKSLDFYLKGYVAP